MFQNSKFHFFSTLGTKPTNGPLNPTQPPCCLQTAAMQGEIVSLQLRQWHGKQLLAGFIKNLNYGGSIIYSNPHFNLSLDTQLFSAGSSAPLGPVPWLLQTDVWTEVGGSHRPTAPLPPWPPLPPPPHCPHGPTAPLPPPEQRAQRGRTPGCRPEVSAPAWSRRSRAAGCCSDTVWALT